MDKLNRLMSEYQNHQFTGGGQTGNDYLQFESDFKQLLKGFAKDIDAQLITFNSGHYSFSAFIERKGKFAYIAISDVRHFKNDWRDAILVRTAKSEKDFSGGHNTFSPLTNLEASIDKTLK